MPYDWINYFYSVGVSNPDTNRWIYIYLSFNDFDYDGLF